VVKLFNEDPVTVAAAKSYLKIDTTNTSGSISSSNTFSDGVFLPI
jgi:hypothetical protein